MRQVDVLTQNKRFFKSEPLERLQISPSTSLKAYNFNFPFGCGVDRTVPLGPMSLVWSKTKNHGPHSVFRPNFVCVSKQNECPDPTGYRRPQPYGIEPAAELSSLHVCVTPDACILCAAVCPLFCDGVRCFEAHWYGPLAMFAAVWWASYHAAAWWDGRPLAVFTVLW